MTLVEDNQMVQTFAPDRPDSSLDVRILPRLTCRSDDLGDAHHFDPPAEYRTVGRVAVAQQKAGSAIPGEGFGQLPQQPACSRMLSDIEADNPAAVVGQYEHHEKEPERS